MGLGLVAGSCQSVKKEKFWMKQLMLNKVLESCKNDIGWYKNYCKTKKKQKKLVAVPSKLPSKNLK